MQLWYFVAFENGQLTYDYQPHHCFSSILRSQILRTTWPFITFDKQLCPGTLNTAHLSNAITLSFLYLFYQFYKRTYTNKGSKETKGKETNKTK